MKIARFMAIMRCMVFGLFMLQLFSIAHMAVDANSRTLLGLNRAQQDEWNRLSAKYKSNPAEAHYQFGAYLRRDWQLFSEAKAQYQMAIELKPDYADPYTGLALLELDVGTPLKAVQYFEKALECDADDAFVRLSYAETLHHKLNKLSEAKQQYEILLKQRWTLQDLGALGVAKIHDSLAEIWMSDEFNNDYDAAQQELHRAIERSPQHAVFHYHLARLLEHDRVRKYGEARQEYEKAQELAAAGVGDNKLKEEIAVNLAVMLWQKSGDDQAARSTLENILKSNPTNEIARNTLIELLQSKFADSDALPQQYELALRENPNNYEYHYLLAQWKRRQDLERDAMYHLDKAIELKPGFCEARQLLASLLLKSDDFQDKVRAWAQFNQLTQIADCQAFAQQAREALSSLDHVGKHARRHELESKLVRNPFSSDLLHQYAVLLWQDFGEYEKALEKFDEAVSVGGASWKCHYDFAMFLLTDHVKLEHKEEKAIDHLRAAKNLNPSDADSHYQLAMLLQTHDGDIPEIEREFREAVSRSVDIDRSVVYRTQYALWLRQQGVNGFAPAQEQLEVAMQIDPRNPSVRRELNNLLQQRLERGQLDATAVKERLQVLLAMDPSDVNVRMHLGHVHMKLGEFAAAKEKFDEVQNAGGAEAQRWKKEAVRMSEQAKKLDADCYVCYAKLGADYRQLRCGDYFHAECASLMEKGGVNQCPQCFKAI